MEKAADCARKESGLALEAIGLQICLKGLHICAELLNLAASLFVEMARDGGCPSSVELAGEQHQPPTEPLVGTESAAL